MSTHLEIGNEARSPAQVRMLLTAEQAAQSLAIGRTKVFELIRSGELESIRIGSSRRIPIDAIEEFVFRLRSN
jgi:excisionase family DNA binding protein